MNEEEIREQPQSELTAQKQIEEESGAAEVCDEGSLGKFKSAQALQKAYENLQAEFTRKCQKLSELTKAMESSADQTAESQDKPAVYEQDDWHNQVASFIASHPDAKEFASEISNCLISNPEMAKSSQPLEMAWGWVVQQKYRNPKTLLNDDEYVEENILKNQTVKQKVLDLYLKELAKSNAPIVISGGIKAGGSISMISPTKFPKDLREAKEMARKLFEN